MDSGANAELMATKTVASMRLFLLNNPSLKCLISFDIK
jgi:hypothetical protein